VKNYFWSKVLSGIVSAVVSYLYV